MSLPCSGWQSGSVSPHIPGSKPVLAERAKQADPLNLIWLQRDGKLPQGTQWPLDTIFPGVQCAFFRSSWEDPNALFLAVKGGDNKAPHAHLDLGSFVLDAGGVRWAADLGPDDYNLPGYFGKQRWGYYRMRTESHNTPLVDQENQGCSRGSKDYSPRFWPGSIVGANRSIALLPGKDQNPLPPNWHAEPASGDY